MTNKKEKKDIERKKEKAIEESFIACLLVVFIFIFFSMVSADPTGPTSINITANDTKNATSAIEVNVSGGVIAKMNITASVQNPHWKAFVGWIDGRFTLDDASGSTIYDWTLPSIGGEVFATRNSSTPSWASVDCANTTHMLSEDQEMYLTGGDNISSTFTDNNNSVTFFVAGQQILANDCPAVYTYINSTAQYADFEEVIIYDNTNLIFVTILEEDLEGYDGNTYDFQMIIPENGSASWSSSTAYYLYVELN